MSDILPLQHFSYKEEQ